MPGDFAPLRGRRHDHAARPRQHLRQHRRREGLPRRGRERADVASRRLRRARGRRPGRAAGPAGRRRRRAARGRHTDASTSSARTSATRSPATRCRAASGSSTRSSGWPPARPTTAGPAATRPNTRRTSCAHRDLRPARHSPPDLRVHPVRARRRGGQPGRRARRARLRAVQRRRGTRRRPDLDGREHRRQAVRRRHRHAGEGPDRGHADRPRPVHPGRAPHVRRGDAAQARRAAAAGRRRPGRGRRARLAALGRARARRRRAAAPDQADRQRARLAAEGRHRPGARSTACRWPRSPARPSTRARTSTTASTSSSRRAPRPAGTPARSRRWCSCPRSSTRSATTRTVLAAGGIGSGRQIAAALALGAGGRVDGLVLADDRRSTRSAPATR